MSDLPERSNLRAFTESLGLELGEPLLDFLSASGPGAASGPATVELYLCALYRRHPTSTLRFFARGEALEHLAQKLHPLPDQERVSSGQPAVDHVSSNGYFRRLDPVLANLLWRAVRLATSAGRKSARIADFMGALALEEETLARLRKEWGLEMRGLLGED